MERYRFARIGNNHTDPASAGFLFVIGQTSRIGVDFPGQARVADFSLSARH
jgi:hypothetical protein